MIERQPLTQLKSFSVNSKKLERTKAKNQIMMDTPKFHAPQAVDIDYLLLSFENKNDDDNLQQSGQKRQSMTPELQPSFKTDLTSTGEMTFGERKSKRHLKPPLKQVKKKKNKKGTATIKIRPKENINSYFSLAKRIE